MIHSQISRTSDYVEKGGGVAIHCLFLIDTFSRARLPRFRSPFQVHQFLSLFAFLPSLLALLRHVPPHNLLSSSEVFLVAPQGLRDASRPLQMRPGSQFCKSFLGRGAKGNTSVKLPSNKLILLNIVFNFHLLS